MSAVRISAWEAAIKKLLDLEEGTAARPDYDLYCIESASSTMDVAREIGAHLERGRMCLVVAREQTAGRGRQGRRWTSAADGLTATLAWKPPLPLDRLSGLSLAVGCALQRAVRALGVDVHLKWPNDLLDDEGRKLAGILIETSGSEQPLVGIGYGINIGAVSGEIPGAVGLCDFLPPRSNVDTSQAFVAGVTFAHLRRMLPGFVRQGFAAFRAEWLAGAIGVGRPIAIDTGAEIVEGSFVDVDSGGALIVETSGGRRLVSAGHVVSPPPGAENGSRR